MSGVDQMVAIAQIEKVMGYKDGEVKVSLAILRTIKDWKHLRVFFW